MIFQSPRLLDQELEALATVDQLRGELRFAVAEPRRWLGGLRRLYFAKAVQGSNSIEGYDTSLNDVLNVVEGEEPLDGHALVRAAMAHLNLVMIHPFADGNGRMEESEGEQISDQSAGLDLRRLATAELFEAKGETRGRHYIASPTLRQVWGEVRATRPKPAQLNRFSASPTKRRAATDQNVDR